MLVGAGKDNTVKRLVLENPFVLLILTNNIYSKAVCKYNASMPGYGT